MTNVLKTRGLYDTFPRKGGNAQEATHYCGGCGHGIIHKLIGEAMADLGIQDRAIVISPVGCSVFGYYYFDAGNVQAAHGRAAAVGTAISRIEPQSVMISYQGDGDLASIGFNQTFQAANRGDRMVIFFVNNGVYGMTGGQLAPTSLPGQKTATSPKGRDTASTGYPVHVCELMNQLEAPVYIERCSVADAKRVMQARRAIRHALEIQRDGKGFALVEFLSPGPTCLHMEPLACADHFINVMEKEFPLGKLRDRAAETPVATPDTTVYPTLNEYFGVKPGDTTPPPLPPAGFSELRIKFSGYGGQGILRLGLLVAESALKAGCAASWYPFYGPEQRGGDASCAVVLSSGIIGSPVVIEPDLLVAMNQIAADRFAVEVAPKGIIVYESSIAKPPVRDDVRLIPVPAIAIADQAGNAQAANTAMLAALAYHKLIPVSPEALLATIEAGFTRKPAAQALNRQVFAETLKWCAAQNGG